MKLSNLFYKALQDTHHKQSRKRLRALEKILPAPHTRLAVPFLFRGVGFFKHIRPMQSQAEIGELYRAVMERRPRVVVEIGTCHGGTLYLWCQASSPEATLVSIDLPEGEFGGSYRACRAGFYRDFASPGQTVHLLRADSHSPKTVELVAATLGHAPIDFLFIDGDHTYDGVKRDFELYLPLVAKGGMVALHDIHPRPEEPRIEVWRFWEELRARYPEATEWIDDSPQGRPIGIGLIHL